MRGWGRSSFVRCDKTEGVLLFGPQSTLTSSNLVSGVLVGCSTVYLPADVNVCLACRVLLNSSRHLSFESVSGFNAQVHKALTHKAYKPMTSTCTRERERERERNESKTKATVTKIKNAYIRTAYPYQPTKLKLIPAF